MNTHGTTPLWRPALYVGLAGLVEPTSDELNMLSGVVVKARGSSASANRQQSSAYLDTKEIDTLSWARESIHSFSLSGHDPYVHFNINA
jgi:hypothetical protein